MSKRNLPLGTLDELGPQMALKQQITQVIQSKFTQQGFAPIKTPVLEYADVFTGMNGDHLGTYRLPDEEEQLILRPDLTLPIARVMSTTGLEPPIKFSYSGDVFRRHKRHTGGYDQLTQAGVEIIGYPGNKAEEECLLLAGQLCTDLGLRQFTIELGNAAFVDLVLAALPVNAAQRLSIKAALLAKNLTVYQASIQGLAADTSYPFLQKWPWLFGPLAEVTRVLATLPPVAGVPAVLTDLQRAAEFVQRNVPNATVTIDLCSTAPQPYYTGLTFHAYGDAGDYLFSGGRYDRLLASFQQTPLAAVGFAFDIDALVVNVPQPQQPQAQLVFFNEDQWQAAQQYVAAQPNATLCLVATRAAAERQAQLQDAQLIDLTTGEVPNA